MCANDLIVQGAEPLFFLDYYATGKLDSDVAAEVVASIAEGCRQAGCALIGGETAEMPGMYADGDYDLAGFCVGAVERDKVLTGGDIAPGDVLLGLASSGVHSNGFSLVRRIIAERRMGSRPSAIPGRMGARSAKSCSSRRESTCGRCFRWSSEGRIKGLAHITGGGLLENIPRVLPDRSPCRRRRRRLAAARRIRASPRGRSRSSLQEMVRTFNCGIGMVVVVGSGRSAKASPQRSRQQARPCSASGESKKARAAAR